MERNVFQRLTCGHQGAAFWAYDRFKELKMALMWPKNYIQQ